MANTFENSREWFKGKTALVTGASSGIGRAVALELGRLGANVCVNYRSSERKAQDVCAEITQHGGSAIAAQADVSIPDEVDSMFGQLQRQYGPRLDMLVNNAGDWMDKQPILSCTVEQWERMYHQNARSVFLCCKLAGQKMAEQRSGSIVNVGSLAAHTGGGGGTVPYAAAKAAVHTFTRGFAREMAPYGVRVNGVAPGMVQTPMIDGRVTQQAEQQLKAATPLARYGDPSEVSTSVVFLLSPAASFITGIVMDVNGGLLMR